MAFMNSPKILIVEDDESIRELYCQVLEGEGYEVETCVNGKEALLFLKHQEEPCLILLDMQMPIMDGREFMDAFKKRPHSIVPIPVYLVSATASSAEGKEMGCRGFMKKPFPIEALLTIARAHCEVNEFSGTVKPIAKLLDIPFLKKQQPPQPLTAIS